ncbi:MAG: hypothetical protein HY321_01020 [Armatimonadetes bacterium]|nr:hypothetical protein [Armatimonadota bacterium]
MRSIQPRMKGLVAVGVLIAMAAGPARAGESPAAPPETAPAEAAAAEAGEDGGGRGKSYAIRYRLDVRPMAGSDPAKLEVMAAEAEVTGEAGEHVEYAIQIPAYTAMKGRGKEMHFGNLYAIFRRNLGEPTLKVGQFVIPFGNLVNYETHTRPVQTLYRYSLGVRIDPGAELEGFLNKDTEFQLAVTTGNGSFRKDNNANKVVTARVSRTFELGDNELRLGVSALRGKLPVFSLMSDPVMGSGEVLEFSMKNRVGLDAEYYRGPYLVRAELVGGDDNGRGAYGHWVQLSVPLSYKTSIDVGTERWKQFSGKLSGNWIGIEHKLTDNRILRLALQSADASEGAHPMSMTMITGQLLVEF